MTGEEFFQKLEALICSIEASLNSDVKFIVSRDDDTIRLEFIDLKALPIDLEVSFSFTYYTSSQTMRLENRICHDLNTWQQELLTDDKANSLLEYIHNIVVSPRVLRIRRFDKGENIRLYFKHSDDGRNTTWSYTIHRVWEFFWRKFTQEIIELPPYCRNFEQIELQQDG